MAKRDLMMRADGKHGQALPRDPPGANGKLGQALPEGGGHCGEALGAMSEEPAPQYDRLALAMHDHGEATMECFIKHQMMVILQPFVGHIKEVDVNISHFEERLNATEKDLLANGKCVEQFKADLSSFRSDLKRTESNIAAAHDEAEACMKRDELLEQSVQQANSLSQRIHEQVVDIEAIMPELRRGLANQESESQSMRANMDRINDYVSKDLKRTLDRLSNELKDHQSVQGATASEIEKLRRDHAHHDHILVETRQAVEQGRAQSAGLQKSVELLREGEAHLGSRLEGWKNQWSKLHPAVEDMKKENACLRQHYDHHEATIFAMQRDFHTTFQLVEELRGKSEKAGIDLDNIREILDETRQGLNSTQIHLSKTNQSLGATQTGLQRAENDLQKAANKIEGLDTRHVRLSHCLDQTNSAMGELTRDFKRTTGTVQSLHHEVQKAHDTLSATRNQVDDAHAGLQGLRTNLGRSNDTIKKLEHGVQLCRAGFSGLQRGFVETGSHVTNQKLTLPKLSTPSPKSCCPTPRGPLTDLDTTTLRGTNSTGDTLNSFSDETLRFSTRRNTPSSSCYEDQLAQKLLSQA
eukprot:TRINITY_DN16595_c0_g1_i1.p1 TRINITY_DN16595_c0_g1~~TRINITY_DN16595_c0_g1_i1.p1  ORF type:complete len:582 (-),score=91.78 TRINITY_DN16595_c0_g1_i1:108-1853(-)